MRVLRGFPAQDIVACYTEAAGGGDIEDINSPCNAPAKTPASYLDKIAFHSDFFQYELAMPLQTVTVNHAAVASVAHVLGADAFFGGGSPISATVYGDQGVGSNTLVNHALGYVPLTIVAWNSHVVVGGTVVQAPTNQRRFASIYADAANIGVNWSGYSDTSALPAVDVTYQVLVFRTPAANPALPLFSGDGSAFQIGRGKISSEAQYLRKKLATESWFDFDLDRTVDLNNGGVRVITGGNSQNDPFYGGSFAGGGYVPVGV